jgi:hypothetical protein
VVSHPRKPRALDVPITVLQTEHPGVLVDVSMPRTRPAKFIKVSLLTARSPNVVSYRPRILVECWAGGTNRYHTAYDMALDSIKALEDAGSTFVEDIWVRCFDDIEGPVPFPDPDVPEMERFQFHGDLHLGVTPGS